MIHRIRDALASRFLVSLRRATHRMSARLRKVKRCNVLVVAPHMDDEVIPCGGTLLLHRQKQSTVRVLFVSDSGGPSGDAAQRQQLASVRAAEMKRARRLLGYQTGVVLGFPDGRLVRHEEKIAQRLVEELESVQPDIVFCPFPADAHGDHQAVALAVAEASHRTRWEGEVWSYEVWTTIWPNALVDISEVAREKEKAIRAYASQVEDRDYAGAALGLNRYRGLRHGVTHAEGFYVCSPADFQSLTAKLNEI